MTGLFALVGWVGYSFSPVAKLYIETEAILSEVLPRIYKLNILTDPKAGREIRKIRKQTRDKIRALGVQDENLQVIFEETDGRLKAWARFETKATLYGLKKSYMIELNPVADTSAERVDW